MKSNKVIKDSFHAWSDLKTNPLQVTYFFGLVKVEEEKIKETLGLKKENSFLSTLECLSSPPSSEPMIVNLL